jgi:hypothetical protein
MTTMSCMARLSDKNKLSARTARQIVVGVKSLLAKLEGKEYEYRGRGPSIEGLVGAVVLDFLERPEAEKLALLRTRLPEVEAMLKDPTIQVRIGNPSLTREQLIGPVRVAADSEAEKMKGRGAKQKPPKKGTV